MVQENIALNGQNDEINFEPPPITESIRRTLLRSTPALLVFVLKVIFVAVVVAVVAAFIIGWLKEAGSALIKEAGTVATESGMKLINASKIPLFLETGKIGSTLNESILDHSAVAQ